jgi:Uma2 family endonuclease
MAVHVQPRYSPEEYLALERKAEYKSEYVNGFIFAMAGTSREHNRIALNVARGLDDQMRGRPCDVFILDVRLKVSETGLYTYPDVTALCGEARFEDAEVDTLLNPTVIVEVLSKSTEAYDRGEKFGHYRQLESLAEYVMVAQDRVCVERYVRQGSDWVLTEFRDLDDTLHLASIDCDLPLREIYDRVKFPEIDAETGQSESRRRQPPRTSTTPSATTAPASSAGRRRRTRSSGDTPTSPEL